MTKKQTPLDRLNYSGELEPVIYRLADAYAIGKPIDFSVIGIGYEDCNIIVETSQGKYVAKIFSKERTPEAIERYTTIMQKVMEAGVNHPLLLKTQDGKMVFSDSEANGISMVLMEFIEGPTFLELNRAPDTKERAAIIEQAVKINKIEYHPPYFFDSWAVPNIEITFEEVKQFIQPEDMPLIQKVMTRFAEIPIQDLPYAFVHGDFTKVNVIKSPNDKIYILDFSVSNWYPRIQELAVIAVNLFYEENSPLSLRDKTELIAEEYDKLNPLTQQEKEYLYAYALAGLTMEFLVPHQEKFIKGNMAEETDYWLNLGRNGLKKELEY